MKQWKPLAIGAAAIAAATATFVAPRAFDSRSVRPASLHAEALPPAEFKREESAALFVGVRKFTSADMVEVPYAVDDAVDLAYLFAFDSRVGLVPPQRVVLALSGRPQKEESKRRLRELEGAGARVETAQQSDILTLLQQQAALAGRSGILIVSLATHGFVKEGIPYILGQGSVFQYPGTAVPAPTLFEMAATSEAARSLFFVDACRNRLTEKTRGGTSDPAAAAPRLDLVRSMDPIAGQAVFYAAAAGQYAYDDDVHQNGVFTKAVIDGLSCEAAASRGSVTADNLATFVERQVRTWIRAHRDPGIRSAIQFSLDGGARNMPLACCRSSCKPVLPVGLIQASSDGSVVTATTVDGKPLWRHDVGGEVTQLEVVDLEEDGPQEVVVGVRERAGGGGQVLVFDRDGRQRTPIVEQLPFRTFATGDLFRKGRQEIVVLWSGDRSPASRLAVYKSSGELLSTYEYRGELQYVTVQRPTNRHVPKIVVTGVDDQGGANVLLFTVTTMEKGRVLWSGSIMPSAETLKRVDFVDSNNDSKLDISLATASGNTLLIDFEGKTIGQHKTRRTAPDARFELLPRSRRR